MADDNTPDTALGPLVNLLAPIGTLATQSDAAKRIAENFGVAWALPWLALLLFLVGAGAALAWVYRRALGRGQAWALWLRDQMPWNRTVRR